MATINFNLPYFSAKYTEPRWLSKRIPGNIAEILCYMSMGFNYPRWTYIFKHLEVGEKFGHGRYHTDGLGTPNETHRLLIYGGEPTLGIDGLIMETEKIWEFPGDYLHKSQEVSKECDRLLLRVTNNPNIKYRNYKVKTK